ncbi:MAG: hypothetical protein HIU86_01310 [Acidobacteria bacterium]|nr:hypothetical protein [Acidobacteriota bacterium]
MSVLTALVSSKIAVAVTVGVVGVGGATAATFTGTLPPALQEQAHRIVGAPAPAQPSSASVPTGSASPVPTGAASPEPTGSVSAEPTDSATPEPTATAAAAAATPTSAAVPADTHGLCTAYFAGGLPVSAVAYQRLATDATAAGAADVSGYCTSAGIFPKMHTRHTVVLPTGTDSTTAPTEARTPHPVPTHAAEATHRSITGAAHEGGAGGHPSQG